MEARSHMCCSSMEGIFSAPFSCTCMVQREAGSALDEANM